MATYLILAETEIFLKLRACAWLPSKPLIGQDATIVHPLFNLLERRYLYERPTSRLQRPLLDPLMEMATEVFNHVEGGWKASAESNELAEKMLVELYRLIGWEDVKVNWPWKVAA